MDYLLRFIGGGKSCKTPPRQPSSSLGSLEQDQQNAPADPYDPFPGRDLVFTLVRENLATQLQVADQQDTKASGILIGATTLFGFAFLVQHHPVGNCSSLIPVWMHHWPVAMRLALPYIPFLVCYILTMIFAAISYRVQKYWDVPNPVTAVGRMDESEKDLKYSLSLAIAHFATVNSLVIQWKAKQTERALYLLLAEMACLVLLLVYQTVC